MNNSTKENGSLSKLNSDLQQVISIPIHLTGIYTYKEAAALSKCSYVTIWRAVANGKLKATTIGSHPRVIGSELLKWIEDGGRTGRSRAVM